MRKLPNDTAGVSHTPERKCSKDRAFIHGTERTRQKLFVPGANVLVNVSTPLTVIVLVS